MSFQNLERSGQAGNAALLIMAKRPSPGQTKTRLMPAFSPVEAAGLYECFLQDVLAAANALPEVTPIIAFTPEDATPYFEKNMPGSARLPQRGKNLGERLDFVLSTALAEGFSAVCAVNSDSPTLPQNYIVQAFIALKRKAIDLVLGPCEDGGYYLIGWKKPQPRLVREVTMSTNHVLEDTLNIAQDLGLTVHLLPTWYDVDTPAQIERVLADLQEDPALAPHTRRFLGQLQTAT